ncbi:hypothetical protein PC113_g16584 [Phytophthora cactorum]|uniref:Uncharacterized protein n=1 Tax=Phytophthora cactorum TaxID=29920 RepID=A0A8T0YLK2_9STRA|nr:hypothetical protein PC113_g16584 [Phytophthora cactorum]
MAPLRILFALLVATATIVGSSTSKIPSLGSGTVSVPAEPTGSFDSSSSAPDSAMEIATPATAKSTVISTYRNWVGTWTMSQDTACYREAHVMDVCPSNYNRNEATNTCWTECPMEYPVECGMECIRQNDDCGIEVASKVSAVAIATLSSASFGVFGALEMLSRKHCGHGFTTYNCRLHENACVLKPRLITKSVNNGPVDVNASSCP